MKKSLSGCCALMEKKYFCNPVLHVTRTTTEGLKEAENGTSSLNEWNDVANNSSNFFECLSDNI